MITILFKANVDAQGGAYATGVLVLITSAAIAVTLSARHHRERGKTIAFGVIAVVFVYTTIVNILERPDGVKIAGAFIAGIIAVSLLSRVRRSFELRITQVDFDLLADRFVRECARRQIRLVANEPDKRDALEYRDKIVQIMADNDLPDEGDIVFAEVTVTDPSEFETELEVRGEVMHGRYRVLNVSSSSVPNALAALLLEIRDRTHRRPHIYFEWTEGSPIRNFMR
ncbi:MAG TPA: hypothetical protein VF054_12570 [Micromonosporaceae bacterium]